MALFRDTNAERGMTRSDAARKAAPWVRKGLEQYRAAEAARKAEAEREDVA